MKAEPDVKGSLTPATLPDCELGGKCRLASRENVYGWGPNDEGGAGIAQCLLCSEVYHVTDQGWRPRHCAFCDKSWGKSTHDPCLVENEPTGRIEGTLGACCGHGDPARRYGIPGEE